MTATVRTNSSKPQVPGPVLGTIMTPGYAKAVARRAYACGWPMVNIQSRRRPCSASPMPVFRLGWAFAWAEVTL